MTSLPNVLPGDKVTFDRLGVTFAGGVAWQSADGNVWAGDTCLRLRGDWLPLFSPGVLVTVDKSHRRPGESWR